MSVFHQAVIPSTTRYVLEEIKSALVVVLFWTFAWSEPSEPGQANRGKRQPVDPKRNKPIGSIKPDRNRVEAKNTNDSEPKTLQPARFITPALYKGFSRFCPGKSRTSFRNNCPPVLGYFLLRGLPYEHP